MGTVQVIDVEIIADNVSIMYVCINARHISKEISLINSIMMFRNITKALMFNIMKHKYSFGKMYAIIVVLATYSILTYDGTS